jgi:hypothetical protein
LKQEVATILLGQVMTSEQFVLGWADVFVAGNNIVTRM